MQLPSATPDKADAEADAGIVHRSNGARYSGPRCTGGRRFVFRFALVLVVGRSNAVEATHATVNDELPWERNDRQPPRRERVAEQNGDERRLGARRHDDVTVRGPVLSVGALDSLLGRRRWSVAERRSQRQSEVRDMPRE